MSDTYELNGHILINNGNGVYEAKEEIIMNILSVNDNVISFYKPLDDRGNDLIIGIMSKEAVRSEESLSYMLEYQKEHQCRRCMCQKVYCDVSSVFLPGE